MKKQLYLVPETEEVKILGVDSVLSQLNTGSYKEDGDFDPSKWGLS